LPVILNEVKDHSPTEDVYVYLSYLRLILHFVQDDMEKNIPLLVYLYSVIGIYPASEGACLVAGRSDVYNGLYIILLAAFTRIPK